MAEKIDRKIKEKDIVGLKYFDQLGELLQQLHDGEGERARGREGERARGPSIIEAIIELSRREAE